jgi:hypothetical protein
MLSSQATPPPMMSWQEIDRISAAQEADTSVRQIL